MHSETHSFSPILVLNYLSTNGITDIRGFIIEDISTNTVIVSFTPDTYNDPAWSITHPRELTIKNDITSVTTDFSEFGGESTVSMK